MQHGGKLGAGYRLERCAPASVVAWCFLGPIVMVRYSIALSKNRCLKLEPREDGCCLQGKAGSRLKLAGAGFRTTPRHGKDTAAAGAEAGPVCANGQCSRSDGMAESAWLAGAYPPASPICQALLPSMLFIRLTCKRVLPDLPDYPCLQAFQGARVRQPCLNETSIVLRTWLQNSWHVDSAWNPKPAW